MNRAEPSALRIAQSSKRQGSEWWAWAMWIEGDPAALDDVTAVIYRLHPTFPSPVIKVEDRATSFRFDTTGWGSFTVGVELRHRDGSVERRRHVLELEGENRGRVFVSSAHDADERLGRAVRLALAERGLAEWTTDDAAAGADWADAIDQAVTDADFGVVVAGGEPSRSVIAEMHRIVASGKPLLVVGPGGRELAGFVASTADVRVLDGVSGLGAALDDITRKTEA